MREDKNKSVREYLGKEKDARQALPRAQLTLFALYFPVHAQFAGYYDFQFVL